MILDNLLMFTGTSNGTVTAPASGPNTDAPTTGTQTSTNVIDLHLVGLPVLASGQGARDMGIGDDPALKILVQITVTFLTGTNMNVALQGTTDNGSGAPNSGGWTTYYVSPTIAVASLTAGQRLLDMDMPRPPPGVPVPRFLRLQYVTTGSAMTAGQVEGCIVLDRHDQMYNASNNAVLGGYPPGIVIAN